MPKKYYLDTSIWRDYFENREDKFRPLGEWAFVLIKKIIKSHDFIVYSEWIVKELELKYTKEEIKEIFEIVSEHNLLVKVKTSRKQAKEAGILYEQLNISYGDILHAILARDNDAILVTRDKHFLDLINIVEVKKPEELI